jgi:hypothetical protein
MGDWRNSNGGELGVELLFFGVESVIERERNDEE